MPIDEALPCSIEEVLRRRGISREQLRLAVASDLDAHGRFGAQWLMVSDQELLVIAAEPLEEQPIVAVPLAHIRGAQAVRWVGSGGLELNIAGHPRTIIRYTNALTSRFAGAARSLDRLGRGYSLEDAIERTSSEEARCAGCGKRVEASEAVCPRCVNKGQILRRLIHLAAPYWLKCSLALGLLIGGVAADLVPPFLWRMLVDEVLAPPHRHAHWLTWLGLALVGQQVLRLLITVVTNHTITQVGTTITRDLRSAMFAHLQELSVRYFDRHSVGTLMTRISNDTEELSSLISQALQGFFLNILLILGIGFVLFTLDWRLALYVLVPAPVVLAATYKFWKFLGPRINRYWYDRWRINALLNACLSGIRVVKAFAQERREISRFQKVNHALSEARLGVENSLNLFFPSISFLFGAGGLLVWVVGGGRVMQREISLGTLMAFLGYLGMFYGPLSSLTQISHWMTRFLTAARHVFATLDETVEISEAEGSTSLATAKGAVEFQAVRFGYDRLNTILHDLSFQVKAGEMIGVVGRSGSGKTTLINLICRFYDPQEGRILLDGHDIRTIKKHDLRRQIGLVLQEPYLFGGTIAENIAYGQPGAAQARIIEAAKAANAHDFIVRLPEGYDTRVGERGAGLSGGERQRISIARAILNDPPVLIFDEATSSVDTETERLIQEALTSLMKGRTTFAIAHRLSTLRHADRIMVMDKGRLVEFGTAAELTAMKGVYYHLSQMQEHGAAINVEAAIGAASR